MRLVEDLGMQYATEKSTKKKRFGSYECPICTNVFTAQTANVTSGNTTKCASCARILGTPLQVATLTTKAASRFAEDCSAIHNGKYDYSEVVYKNSYTKVTIICPTHGNFTQKPDAHKEGHGCPKCSISGFDKTIPATLYYLKIIHEGFTLYKIGITNLTLRQRFRREELNKITVVYRENFAIGVDAYDKEQKILKEHKEFRYIGEPILNSGNTELFIKDVLKLDNEGNK